jgi:hypothetical protein
MNNIPAEIKDLEAKLQDPNSDGFTKSDYRQKLLEIQRKTTDKSIRRYIDGVLRKG